MTCDASCDEQLRLCSGFVGYFRTTAEDYVTQGLKKIVIRRR